MIFCRLYNVAKAFTQLKKEISLILLIYEKDLISSPRPIFQICYHKYFFILKCFHGAAKFCLGSTGI